MNTITRIPRSKETMEIALTYHSTPKQQQKKTKQKLLRQLIREYIVNEGKLLNQFLTHESMPNFLNISPKLYNSLYQKEISSMIRLDSFDGYTKALRVPISEAFYRSLSLANTAKHYSEGLKLSLADEEGNLVYKPFISDAYMKSIDLQMKASENLLKVAAMMQTERGLLASNAIDSTKDTRETITLEEAQYMLLDSKPNEITQSEILPAGLDVPLPEVVATNQLNRKIEDFGAVAARISENPHADKPKHSERREHNLNLNTEETL